MHLELLCSSNACKIRPGFVCWGILENHPTVASKYAMINDTNNSNVKNSPYFLLCSTIQMLKFNLRKLLNIEKLFSANIIPQKQTQPEKKKTFH